MATTKPIDFSRVTALLRQRPRIGWLWQGWAGRGLLAGLLVGLGALAWFWATISGNAVTAASVGARIACSCHFVEGRPLGQCRDDFEPGMGLVTLSADENAKSVTARVLVLSRQTASLRAGAGCVLEPWGN
ncbi:MAG: hypothetical protein KGJ57_11515 [Sphingomonadales bacterium]|nr:hypothetical protein [Sphingomonadales bacterium]MDE2170043.1 hypothetical protein [Sphingomonadales bacterium]